MAHPIPVCIADLEAIAKQKLSRNAWDYYASGGDDMITLKRNQTAFSRIRIKPRVLRDVSDIKLHTTIQGSLIASPIAVAPSAMQCMAHPDGEKATARACASMRTAMILSSWSTTSLEDVAAAGTNVPIDPLSLAANLPSDQEVDPVRWFQLYVYKDRVVTRQLVERAEAAGYKALAVTVDTPILGRRRPDMRNKFRLPSYLRLANFDSADAGKQNVGAAESNDSGLATYVAEQIDPTLSWDDIAWLRSFTKLPIIVKGILTEEDAKEAVKAGVSGIIVSNHGGRQLDGVPATIDVLAEVVKAVENRVEVYMDGGVRRGSDVFKALALGARAVFVGRPVLWGLAYQGEEGVRTMLRLLEEELYSCMALAGCQSLEDIKPSMLTYEPAVTARL
jgi:(S)-2-hydroxy-acid oxidase